MAVQAAQNAGQSVAQGSQAGMASGAVGGGAATNSTVGVAAAVLAVMAMLAAVLAGVAISTSTFASQGDAMQLLPGTSLVPSPAPSLPPSFSVSLCGETEILRNGEVSILFEGFSRPFNDSEVSSLNDEFLEAYNSVSGGCSDTFHRNMVNSNLLSSTPIQAFADSAEASMILSSEWDAAVRCHECSATQPLFEEGEDEVSPNRRFLKAENNTSIDFGEFLAELQLRMSRLAARGSLQSTFKKILRGRVHKSTGHEDSDGDGVSNYDEMFVHETDPNDTDEDGL
jgi:hypothetical protein